MDLEKHWGLQAGLVENPDDPKSLGSLAVSLSIHYERRRSVYVSTRHSV